jgi:hypothetical protein
VYLALILKAITTELLQLGTSSFHADRPKTYPKIVYEKMCKMKVKLSLFVIKSAIKHQAMKMYGM